MKELILGGVRSGKSALAQQRAERSGLAVTYIATATVEDDEMAARVARHRAERPPQWELEECPIELAATLETRAASGRLLLVDCLTLWLTNLLMREDESLFQSRRQALLELLPRLPGEIIFVSNEVNMGVVPMGTLSRRFCDEAGWLHQALATHCDRVSLVVAGIPMLVKGAAE